MIKKIYFFSILLSVLVSMNAWFIFFMKIGTTFLLLDLITISFIINHKHLFNRISQNKNIFILIIIAYLIGARTIDSWKWCVMTFPTLTLLFAKNELLSQVLITISKWLAIILVPGIILHLLIFIYPLPVIAVSYTHLTLPTILRV